MVARSLPVLQQDANTRKIDAGRLRQFALDSGADDAGVVEIGDPELEDQRADILKFYPKTKSLLSIVCRMNREPIRNPARSVANLEFHTTGEEVNDVCRAIVKTLESQGIPAINSPMGFPMESDKWTEKMWVVSHKPVAVAAGLGRMGIHRNVIHPKFGNFILLGTVLIGEEATEYNQPIDYNPCLSCKLCVAACPVGAISPDGQFDLASCYTHNYREFMGGFGDWVEQIADSKNGLDLRKKVAREETVSMWQSLAFGPNYKAAYCLSVCPAGEEVIGPFQADRKGFLEEIVKPLQEKEETIYVVPKSDADDYVRRRFPHKKVKHVRGSLLPRSIPGFLTGIQRTFQRGQSAGLNAVYHFTFTGKENVKATVVIQEKTLRVADGHEGTADLRMTADSETWLGFLAKERGLLRALLTRKIRIKGSPKLLVAFGKCFPN
ncbi:SCP2 sterol-binding domain-containing protein [Telmatocola sphagniphila]|uniref:SCP2 sterol-binding domain-containing protein n=1 Tax=Telmatocola sphagniphila TaxID=1123043 RepID=A0A8E6EX00_9BACT|nr:SCP2 sterol-binding domain-containing protein [Telmatocola sphagniphila]QVL30731.1 SCP2 sterol-binding domain-containing protein [Telmatocola sphagniphila]